MNFFHHKGFTPFFIYLFAVIAKRYQDILHRLKITDLNFEFLEHFNLLAVIRGRGFKRQGCFLVMSQPQQAFLAYQGIVRIFKTNIFFEKFTTGQGAKAQDFFAYQKPVR